MQQLLPAEQTLTCTATAEDDFGGVAVEDNSFTIGNTAPEVTGVTVSSATATTSDSITCSGTANDVDGDPLTHSYTWTNLSTGVAVGYAETLTLTPLQVSPGDSLNCTYEVSDGTSNDSDTALVTIVNSNPSITSLSLTPTSPILVRRSPAPQL